MQERSIAALQVHPFFIWRLTTLASSSLDWDPVLSQKSVARKKRGRAGGDGEREEERGVMEVERRRKFGVGGECVYASVCKTLEKKKVEREKEMEREMENR